jgi:hypothetical protein
MDNYTTFKTLLATSEDAAEEFLRDTYGLSYFQAYTFVMGLPNVSEHELSYTFGALDAYIGAATLLDQLPKREDLIYR